MGVCAKQVVTAFLRTKEGKVYRGTNDCANPQAVCPRLEGEDYTKCTTICQQPYHAEVAALMATPEEESVGATIYLLGHDHPCPSCQMLCDIWGIKEIIIMVVNSVDMDAGGLLPRQLRMELV